MWIACGERTDPNRCRYGQVLEVARSKVLIRWEPWQVNGVSETWVSSRYVRPTGTLRDDNRGVKLGDRVWHNTRKQYGTVQSTCVNPGGLTTPYAIVVPDNAYQHEGRAWHLSNLYMAQHVETIM